MLPDGSQAGVRWSHVGGGLEYALSFFDGFNHLPNIAVDAAVGCLTALSWTRIYPAIRTYGADAAVPTPLVHRQRRGGLLHQLDAGHRRVLIYVIQLERQTGEWILVGGYAGEVVTMRRASLTFAPDRALTRAIVGRASYTIDSNRSLAFEGAVRQNGDGLFCEGRILSRTR